MHHLRTSTRIDIHVWLCELLVPAYNMHAVLCCIEQNRNLTFKSAQDFLYILLKIKSAVNLIISGTDLNIPQLCMHASIFRNISWTSLLTFVYYKKCNERKTAWTLFVALFIPFEGKSTKIGYSIESYIRKLPVTPQSLNESIKFPTDKSTFKAARNPPPHRQRTPSQKAAFPAQIRSKCPIFHLALTLYKRRPPPLRLAINNEIPVARAYLASSSRESARDNFGESPRARCTRVR